MSDKCRHCHQQLSSTYRGLAEGLTSCARCATNFDFSNLQESIEIQGVPSAASAVVHLSDAVNLKPSESVEALPLADIEEIEIDKAQSTLAEYDVKRALKLLLAERKLLKRKVVRLTEDNETLETELTRVQHGNAQLEQELMQTRELAARLRAKRAKAGLLESQALNRAARTKESKEVAKAKPAKRGQTSVEKRAGSGLHAGGSLPYANNLISNQPDESRGSATQKATPSNCAQFSERESQLGQGAQRAEQSGRSKAFINGGRG